MIKPITHYAVNWIDGMKISQRHFEAQANFTIDSLRDVSSLGINSYNYGLLPLQKKGEKDQELFSIYNTVTNDVQIDIKECQAITPAGYRIELFDYSINLKSLTGQISEESDEIKMEYFIVISVKIFSKIPHGDIDLEETPPRHPYVKPSYHVELLPSSTFDTNSIGGNYIVIGKANIQGAIIKADTNFIPPCVNLFSHPILVSYYGDYARYMGSLQQFAIRIIQKNININQNTKLATNVKLLCETLVVHIGNVYFQFRNIIPQQPPIFMIDVFSQLSIHLFNTTQSISTLDLEEMLSYIYEWSEVAPHTFLNLLSNVSEINYNHINCAEYLILITSLLKNLEMVFAKLADLDYIGQRKENIIVNEQDITTVSKPNSGWSVLD